MCEYVYVCVCVCLVISEVPVEWQWPPDVICLTHMCKNLRQDLEG